MNKLKIAIPVAILIILPIVIHYLSSSLRPTRHLVTQTSTTPSSTLPAEVSSDETALPSYIPYDDQNMSADIQNSLNKKYGKNNIKVNSYELFGLYETRDKKEPFILNSGNYKFVFGLGKNGEEPTRTISTSSPHAFQIFNGDKLVFSGNPDSSEGFFFTDVSLIDYEGTKYYITSGYTGGIHCCNIDYPTVVRNGVLRTGEPLYGEDGLTDDRIFIKDNRLYVWKLDSRFAYFLAPFSFSGPMFYPSFYRFDKTTGNLISANNEFKSLYAPFIGMWNKEVEKLKTGNYDKEDTVDRWPPVLAARTIYQLLSGQNKNTALKEFSDDFIFLKEKYGIDEFFVGSSTVKEIKKEILDKMAGDRK